MIVAVATYHISEAEAARDFASVMVRVRAGYEVIVESESKPVAIIHTPPFPTRTLSESIALAKAHAEELGFEPVMDADFAADMEEIIRNRKPREITEWDE